MLKITMSSPMKNLNKIQNPQNDQNEDIHSPSINQSQFPPISNIIIPLPTNTSSSLLDYQHNLNFHQNINDKPDALFGTVTQKLDQQMSQQTLNHAQTAINQNHNLNFEQKIAPNSEMAFFQTSAPAVQATLNQNETQYSQQLIIQQLITNALETAECELIQESIEQSHSPSKPVFELEVPTSLKSSQDLINNKHEVTSSASDQKIEFEYRSSHFYLKPLFEFVEHSDLGSSSTTDSPKHHNIEITKEDSANSQKSQNNVNNPVQENSFFSNPHHAHNSEVSGSNDNASSQKEQENQTSSNQSSSSALPPNQTITDNTKNPDIINNDINQQKGENQAKISDPSEQASACEISSGVPEDRSNQPLQALEQIKLNDKWTFWFSFRGNKIQEQTKVYRDRFTRIGEADSVDDVVSYVYSLKTPINLPDNVQVMFFRNSIHPDWESNEKGGSWSIKFEHSDNGYAELTEFWENLVYSCAGESFGQNVIGIVLNRRAKFENTVEIWMGSLDSNAVVFQTLTPLLKRECSLTLTNFHKALHNAPNSMETYVCQKQGQHTTSHNQFN